MFRPTKYLSAFYGIITAIIIILFVTIFTDLIYHNGDLLKRGYIIIAEGSNGTAKSAVKIEIGKLFQSANLDNGKKIFNKCATCHNIAENGANKVGPNLWNIVGRERASNANFVYSTAMKEKSGKWTYEDLFHFINAPKKFVKGTKMGFAGIKNEQDLADVILYLKSSSPNAPNLPDKDITIDPLK